MKKFGIIIGLWLTGLWLVGQKAWAAESKLEFVPSTLSIMVGETKVVDVFLSPNGNQVIGVDLMLQFDHDRFSLQEITNAGAFPSQLGTQIDNNTGTAKVAFSNSYGVYQTNPVTVAHVKITGKAAGSASLRFNYTAGQTNDTNVVINNGVDSLTTVVPLSLVVASSTSNSPSPSSSPGSTPAPTPTTMPGASASLTPSASPKNDKDKEKDKDKDKENKEDKPKGIISPLGDDDRPKKRGSVLGAFTDSLDLPSWFGWWIPLVLVGTGGTLFAVVIYLHRREQQIQVNA